MTDARPTDRRLELRGIAKTYETPDGNSVHRFTALRDVNLTFRTGCIHTVLGENGAGKSTLMHVISGLVSPSEGSLALDGEPLSFSNSADAIRSGIAMVHQRPRLADGLTVLENALVGLPGTLARRKERGRRLEALAADWDIPVTLRELAQNLSPAGRLRAALLSALFRTPDFLVLDEPTSVLAPEDRERFLAAVRRGSRRGLGVILITHKLDEALRWSDRITVLRHGSVVFDADTPGENGSPAVTRERLAALLDPVETGTAPEPRPRDRQAPERHRSAYGLRAENLAAAPKNRDALRGVSFVARSGAITGIFGAPGSGLKTLEDLLSGMLDGGDGNLYLEAAQPSTGKIPAKRLPAAALSPRELRKAGIAFVPSNRAYRGSDPALTAADVLLPYRQEAFLRDPRAETRYVTETLEAERVEALPSRGAHTLSGGQLQRLIVARELEGNPTVLVLAEPEWGLDLKSVAILRERLRAAADGGTAVLILTDAPDSMHDRDFYDAIYTLREGALP